MRILLISLALLAGLIAGIATAGVAPRAAAPDPETAAVMGMRAFISRCIPGIAAGGAITTTGLERASEPTEHALLGARTGQVWLSRGAEMMLIDFSDAPVCRVVVPHVEPIVMTDMILRVFREADGAFRNERFKFSEGGGFAAVYTATSGQPGLVVRVETGLGANGTGYASLSAERAP